jgi:hypothetical protein
MLSQPVETIGDVIKLKKNGQTMVPANRAKMSLHFIASFYRFILSLFVAFCRFFVAFCRFFVAFCRVAMIHFELNCC